MSDVYSFGVVLLEMLSGRRAIDKNRPSGEHNLVEWAKPCLSHKRRIFRVLDRRLEGQYSMGAAHKATTLALRCLSSEARFRPNMDEVVATLEQLQCAKDAAISPQPELRINQNPAGGARKFRRRSLDETGEAKTSYPRPSASPLYS